MWRNFYTLRVFARNNMKSGLVLQHTDHRDYDFHKTFGSSNFDTKTLPNTFNIDAGLTMPNQNTDGFPMGCTGYAQTDLCTNEDGIIYDAGELYLATPPNDRTSGRDLRSSLNVLVNRGPKQKDGTLGAKRTAYYNVRAQGILDWFEAIRVALWITQDEKRGSSVAVPWFPEFEQIGSDGILPTVVSYDWNKASGHDAVISGWTDTDTKGNLIRNGEVFLKVKSWQGKQYGDNGWCYMCQPLTDAIFNMKYTEAFTVTKMAGNVQKIDMTVIERLVSFILNLLK